MLTNIGKSIAICITVNLNNVYLYTSSLSTRIFGAKNKRLTAQELKIRREEEALFSGITGPPPTLNTLTNGHENGGADASLSPAKKRRRVARDAVSNGIDNA